MKITYLSLFNISAILLLISTSIFYLVENIVSAYLFWFIAWQTLIFLTIFLFFNSNIKTEDSSSNWIESKWKRHNASHGDQGTRFFWLIINLVYKGFCGYINIAIKKKSKYSNSIFLSLFGAIFYSLLMFGWFSLPYFIFF